MPTTPYPVDSATRPCCGGIGGHTRECLPVPAGATEVLPWGHGCGKLNGHPDHRYFWGSDRAGPIVQGLQTTDGTVVRWVNIDYRPDMLSADRARKLAADLLAAADELDTLNAATPGMVTVYDTNSTAVAVVPIGRVAETVTPWFPRPSDAVRDAIAELQQTLNMGRCPDGLAAFLGITVDGDPYDRQRRAELADAEGSR